MSAARPASSCWLYSTKPPRLPSCTSCSMRARSAAGSLRYGLPTSAGRVGYSRMMPPPSTIISSPPDWPARIRARVSRPCCCSAASTLLMYSPLPISQP
ncbi:hypothetical protein CV_0543 [Chromobacterium violaceum ATCC 12472]|uniref:Uncharacterized protein n=1 Tax=Chromobacterium violaceum (strain ATCC 12472 / DSM 30191 / JCM 1249 / CCUG 213 / NBRC 12614 / NCIMB 9131 / NCTC 9757 / MK) TaxID=243365 RepID=Q7NPT1_CHRVO|nr:hypothetical protein CV_0543 [Chromobacterium violaceum ATCC 12472]